VLLASGADEVALVSVVILVSPEIWLEKKSGTARLV